MPYHLGFGETLDLGFKAVKLRTLENPTLHLPPFGTLNPTPETLKPQTPKPLNPEP